MNNVESYLVIKEFNKSDSLEVILEKIKDIFEISHSFINFDDEEENFVEGEDGKTYNSQLEEIFYSEFKSDMELLELKELINRIGLALVDSDREGYDNFNIVYLEDGDKITIAVSLCIYHF